MQTSTSIDTYKFNYRPQNPPAKENWSDNEAYHSGEAIHTKAENTRDLFMSSDNTGADLDPRVGFVHLREAHAPGLLEEQTSVISGFMTDEGDIFASGQDTRMGGTTTIRINGEGDEVVMGRPVYVNNRYMPTVETLVYEQDGSRTYSSEYTVWTDRLN